jgi:hypothetical protein
MMDQFVGEQGLSEVTDSTSASCGDCTATSIDLRKAPPAAVQVLPGMRFPDLINDQPPLIADSFIVPDEALELVREGLQHRT